MRITRYTDYSLRVLLYVALKDNELSTIGEIAAAYDISKNHLMKVVQELAAKGYLLVTRGKNGGMRLNRPAEQSISVHWCAIWNRTWNWWNASAGSRGA